MAEKTKIILTADDKANLEAELRHLIDVERPDVIEALQLARSQGDLSENADYSAARDRQGQIEVRIQELENILRNSEVATKGAGNKVAIGNIVTFKESATGEVSKVRLAGSIVTAKGGNGDDAKKDPLESLLSDCPTVSNESPIGQALLGNKVGSIVTVESVDPYEIEIIEIA